MKWHLIVNFQFSIKYENIESNLRGKNKLVKESLVIHFIFNSNKVLRSLNDDLTNELDLFNNSLIL